MDIMKVIRTLLIRRITRTAKLRPVFTPDALSRPARHYRVYIDYGRRGRNKSWKLQKCTHVRARPLHAACVHCIRGFVCRGGLHKTARHISVHDLCDLRCRASCARSLSTDQSGCCCNCRCCCCCCSSTETDGDPPAPLPATFATLPPASVCADVRAKPTWRRRVYGYAGCAHA